MANVSSDDRYNREENERIRAWSILRKIPEYIADYASAQKGLLSAKQVMSKWGFAPLTNPENDGVNLEFADYFSSYIPEVSRFEKVVDFEGIDNFSREGNVIIDPNNDPIDVSGLPQFISLKINIYAPTTVLINEFQSGVEHIKSVFKIPAKNSSTHDHLEFLVQILVKAELAKKDIIDRLLLDDLKDSDYDDVRRQAYRKRIVERVNKTIVKS